MVSLWIAHIDILLRIVTLFDFETHPNKHIFLPFLFLFALFGLLLAVVECLFLSCFYLNEEEVGLAVDVSYPVVLGSMAVDVAVECHQFFHNHHQNVTQSCPYLIF